MRPSSGNPNNFRTFAKSVVDSIAYFFSVEKSLVHILYQIVTKICKPLFFPLDYFLSKNWNSFRWNWLLRNWSKNFRILQLCTMCLSHVCLNITQDNNRDYIRLKNCITYLYIYIHVRFADWSRGWILFPKVSCVHINYIYMQAIAIRCNCTVSPFSGTSTLRKRSGIKIWRQSIDFSVTRDSWIPQQPRRLLSSFCIIA